MLKGCFSRYTQRLKTVFLAHARAEHDVARQLAEFLEFGCNLTCYVDDGLIGGEQDLISMAEEGLSADVLVLLLTPMFSWEGGTKFAKVALPNARCLANRDAVASRTGDPRRRLSPVFGDPNEPAHPLVNSPADAE
jgi:hypothetical protein